MGAGAKMVGTRSISIKRWAGLGGVVAAAVIAVSLHLSLGSVTGTVIGKEMAGPNCKTGDVGGLAGHQGATCRGTTYTLHVRDRAGRDNPVEVDQRTYEATKVGVVYRG
ncbi:hypothetical protein [Oryzihumus leptocrescens]|uniref:Uncharacterized protein n=1 Tax=Oryzihumus leptocrescens TaxID=297536 RepID=A0A542ZNL7_9MICO|nr:hypothetical protein [Oryzihumus leptocrescens]TQL61935.1 hypothetical protein FB474_3360 [Oryzihumus leptocrescens]